MSNFRHSILSLFPFVALLLMPQGVALADGEGAAPRGSTSTTESSNFGKTERFIPGEEVVTPTGKK